MPEKSSQTDFSPVGFPLSHTLERELRKKTIQKTSPKVAPIRPTVLYSQLSEKNGRDDGCSPKRSSSKLTQIVIEDIFQSVSLTQNEEKQKGERTALVPHMRIIEYYAYEDSVAERLFGRKFRDKILYFNRHYPRTLAFMSLLSFASTFLATATLFSPVSEDKCIALSILTFIASAAHTLVVALAGYPLVKEIFTSFDGWFFTVNLLGCFVFCGIFSYREYGALQAMPFFLNLFMAVQIPMTDALPRKVKQKQRLFLAGSAIVFIGSIIGLIIALNISVAQNKLNDVMLLVGPFKFSTIRNLSSFALNVAIFYTRVAMNLIYHPEKMVLFSNGQRMAKLSTTEDAKSRLNQRMLEMSTQTSFTPITIPLINVLEMERESKTEIKRNFSDKITPTTHDEQPTNIDDEGELKKRNSSSFVIRDLIQVEGMTHIEVKEKGEKTALVPIINMIEYHAYEDSVSEKLFGKRFRNWLLNINRKYGLLLAINSFGICCLFIATAYSIVIPISRDKGLALTICVFTCLNLNFLSLGLASYPLVKIMFTTFEGIYLSVNVFGSFLSSAIFCYYTIGAYQSVNFVIWGIIWPLQIPMLDALPRKMKAAQRCFLGICYATFVLCVFGYILILNLFRSQETIDDVWISVGSLKISILRCISTFGINVGVIYSRFIINMIFYPDNLAILRNRQVMANISHVKVGK